jgi:hypothetical protein
MDLSSQANQQQSAEPRGGSLHTKSQPLTRLLLLCGAIAGPLFIFVLLLQDYTRPGFDPRLDLLSLLSLGDWGWVQMVNFILAGIFRTDPANGFPPGVPAAAQPSWHGAIHALGALFVFLLLAAALLVFVRLFLAWKERWWAVYCLTSAVLFLLIFFTGFTNAAFMARTLRLAVLIGWMAASLVAIKLLSTPNTTQQTRDQ